MNPKYYFNEDFKRWFYNTAKKKNINEYKGIGTYIKSKLSSKNLYDKISLTEEILNETEEDIFIKKLCKDFRKNGGIIMELDSRNIYKIKVDSGEFYIHKYFTKKDEL